MDEKYLIDTNVIIDFSANRLPVSAQDRLSVILNNSPSISVINKIELLGFTSVTKQIILFTELVNVIGLDNDVVQETILIRKQHRIKLPDAIITATAIVHNLTVITRNLTDFKNVEHLKVVDSASLVDAADL